MRGHSGTGIGALVASLLAKLLQVCAPTAEAVPSKWREGVMVRSFHMEVIPPYEGETPSDCMIYSGLKHERKVERAPK